MRGAINNVLDTQCHHNLFLNTAENNTFKYGTYNNYFTKPVINCSGVIHDKETDEILSSATVKQLDFVNNEQVVLYIDPQTLTYQIQQL